jgi:hypothetical protein
MTSARPASAETGSRRGLTAGARLLAVLGVTIVLLLWPVKLPPLGWLPLWWNWMHVPVFGWLTLEAARFVQVTRGWHGWRPVPILLAGAAMLAIGVEHLQTTFGRQADWEDVARSLAGTVGTLAFLQAAGSAGLRKACLLLLALLCYLGSASALLQRAVLMRDKASAFPLLEDFETASSLSLWSLEHDGVPQTLLRSQGDGKWQLEVPIAKEGFSSLRYDAQSRDWARYRALVLHYELEGTSSLHLGVRLDGGKKGRERCYLETHLQPGKRTATIPLPPPSQEKLPMFSRIKTLTLFSSGGTDGVLAIGELRLE